MAVDISIFNAYWTFTGLAGIGRTPTPFGEPAPTSGQNFALVRNLGQMAQSFTSTAPVPNTHTIRFSASRRYYNPPYTQTVKVKVDGVTYYTSSNDIPNNNTYGTVAVPVNNLPPGPHTLSIEGQNDPAAVPGSPDETMYVDSVSITGPGSVNVPLLNPGLDGYQLPVGGVVYRPPAIAVPFYTTVAKVTTSGKLLYCKLVRVAGGVVDTPTAINEAPTIKVNGVARGSLRIADVGFGTITTSAHPSFLIPLPAGVVVAAGDVVTLSGSAGWAFGPGGYVEAMTNQAVDNRVGGSFLRDSTPPRTMQLAVAQSFYTTNDWRNGLSTKNQRHRCVMNPNPVKTDVSRGWYPVEMAAARSFGSLLNIHEPTTIDGVGYPAPTGYWAVRWDDVAPGGTTFALTVDANAIATRVPSLSNPGVGGLGRVEVFDLQRTGTNTDFSVMLQLDVAGPAPWVTRFDNLAILAPGDFTWEAGKKTVIPMPAWHELPDCLLKKLPLTVPFSGFRFSQAGIELGESAACEREHVVNPEDFRWANCNKTFSTIRFTGARPWVPGPTSYVYDPLPGAGTPYNATLFQPITTAPAAGTVETIVISDALTAPILAGLILTIGSERLRVMATPNSPNVSVMRGIESTTPATHTGGVISVSGRRKMDSLMQFGDQNKQITEFTTESPHGVKTGQNVVFAGTWPVFIYTDGRPPFGGGTWSGAHPAFVTGPNSFLTVYNANQLPADAPNNTLGRAYGAADGITPAASYAINNLPEFGGNPYEFAATTAAKYPKPGGSAWISLCNASSDDMIDEIFKRILANFPADRTVYLELGGEIWNFAGSPYRYFLPQAYQLYGIPDPTYWAAVRTQQIRARARAIWAAAGRDPNLIRSTLNLIAFAYRAPEIPGLFNFLATRGGTPDMLTMGIYPDFYYHASLIKAFSAWPLDMVVDMLGWDGHEGTSGDTKGFAGHLRQRIGAYRSMLNNWNAAHSPPVGLGMYEYAPEQPWPLYSMGLPQAMNATQTNLVLPIGDGDPGTLLKIDNTTGEAYDSLWDLYCDTTKVQAGSWLLCESEWMKVTARTNNVCTVLRGQNGTAAVAHGAGKTIRNDYIEGIRDITLHPGYRVVHRDTLELFQELGLEICIPSSLDQTWNYNTGWADYHAIMQRPGMGDGSDGQFDNRLCQARPGQPGTKSKTTSLDANTVSVRGKAFIEFLTVSPTSPTPTPTPTPTGGPRRKAAPASHGFRNRPR